MSDSEQGLEALIARLEDATGPDREIDCLIAIHQLTPHDSSVRKSDGTDADNARVLKTLLNRRSFGIGNERESGDEIQAYLPSTNADYFGVLHYTSSLDAALTLVPPEHAVTVEWSPRFPGCAWVYPPDNVNDIWFEGEAVSPAIALCIAALKARATIAKATGAA